MQLQRRILWLVVVYGLAFVNLAVSDESDRVEVFPLDNGCSITRRSANSTVTQTPWYKLPLPHLNCSGAGLTRLVVEGVVEDTRSITLSYNDLIEFYVDDLEPFPNVEKLELKVNKLRRIIPSSKITVSSLGYLSLSHNQLTEIPDEALQNFPNLKFFVIISNALRNVRRDAFHNNKNLQFLYLGGNPIKTFEDDFLANMTLTSLSLRSCGLTKVPSHIATMSSLMYLDLSVNKLRNLKPNTFRGCEKLRWLEISSNQIKRVDPLAFKGTYKLRMVDLSDNLITTIPNGTFADISKERVEIDLYENPINCDCKNAWLKSWYDKLLEHDLSTEVRFKCAQPLRNYRKKSYQLKLGDFTCTADDQQWQGCRNPTPQSSLPLKTTTPSASDDPTLCPDECTCYDENGHKYATPANSSGPGPRTRIQGFSHMKFATLSVSCTSVGLTQIPVEQIRSDVRMIILSDNNIKILDLRQLRKFKDLEILELKRNKIEVIKSDPNTSLKALTVLNLRFNNLRSVTKNHFKSFPNLQILMLYHNKIHYFPYNLFQNNPKLRRVYLGPNPVIRFQFYFLKRLKIQSLSLTNMSLTNVPREIATMKHLTYLDLSDNSITTLPKNAFSNATALYRVVLENNKISTVDSNAFNGATLLQKIYLSENNIKSLPQGVFSNVSEERLKVELWSNPVVCDCNMKWFKTWIEETEERDPTTDVRFICDTPSSVHNRKSDGLSPNDFKCTEDGAESCSVCKSQAGTFVLTVFLTLVSTIVFSCVAMRCVFKRRYSELLQYAKEGRSYGQVAGM